MVQLQVILLVLLIIGIVWCLITNKNRTEGLSGFGVITGLAFNNKSSYCWPGNSAGSLSPGCGVAHRVIV